MPGLLDSAVELGDGTWFLGAGLKPSQLRINHSANVNAADTTNADQLRSGGGLGLSLTGAGVTVGVWDGGAVRSTHQEFGGRVTVIDAVANSDHGTHVAGTIGASGVVTAARGMATGVSLRSRDWNNDISKINSDGSLIQVSNHSYSYITGWELYNWGFGYEDTWVEDRSVYSVEARGFGKYTSYTRDLDTVLYNNRRLLSVWAASNDRDDSYRNYRGDNTYVTYLSAGGAGPGWYRVSTDSYPAPPADGNAGAGYDSLPTMQAAKNNLVVGAINDVT
ncbi:MAG: S8 family serine peptidase, partial [Verrucomicrobiae bacterium]|nr:S8 family serine peptidase [Verrucomicrobiae bacterium]